MFCCSFPLKGSRKILPKPWLSQEEEEEEEEEEEDTRIVHVPLLYICVSS